MDATAQQPISPPPPKLPDWNQIGLNYRLPMPRPKVRGSTIDFHCHLFKAAHAPLWYEVAAHYGIDKFVTMTPLEEAEILAKEPAYHGRLFFIAIPKFTESDYDDWMRRLDRFYELGSRIIKFHMAPGTMQARGYSLEHPSILKILKSAKDRGMILMTHMGDPDTWYYGKYTDTAKFGTREAHYKMWEAALESVDGHPWLGAHLGGNPEDLGRLTYFLDKFPNLMLDCSATRWMVREVSKQRDPMREFFIKYQDRILFGSDQVSGDDRNWDFLASRWWCHRKLWETAYIGRTPIYDPDLSPENQPDIHGLALPDIVLQKIYHDNALAFMAKVGVTLE